MGALKSSKLKLFVSIVVFSVLCSQAAQAQQGCNIERKVPAKALTELSFKRLNSIYEDIGEERYNEAAEALNDMLKRSRNDEYEQAVIHQALAQVEWARERFDSSLRSFETAVNLDKLPNHAHFAMMYQIAQLYALRDRHNEALEKLELWLCAVPKEQITSAAYVLKASIYAKKEDYRKALTAIETAISMDDNPKEPWYQLKLAAHFELEQFPQAAETLELMILRWPEKKTYWTQLSSIYAKLKRDKRALAVLALAYRQDLLDKQTDIKQLANLYQFLNNPFAAAKVMEKGISDGIIEETQRHWEQIGDAWYQAEELDNALAAFKKSGARSDNGKLDLRRGYILIDQESWSEAKEALSEAIRKGGLDERRLGEAYLLRGMAELNLGNNTQARADFTQARNYEKTRGPAQQWINHLNELPGRQAP